MIYSIILTILIVRSFLYPILRLISLFSKNIKDRFVFEARNFTDIQTLGFKQLAQEASICFHISSEGEFELIRPLIDQCLTQGHKIEIIFSSPSVERQVENLGKLFPEQLNYLRLPILSFCLFPLAGSQNLLGWVSAKKMMMVRYDFFPELLLLKFYMDKFILFAASSKSRSNHDFRFKIKKYLYRLFSEIFPSTKEDEKFFKINCPNNFIHTELDLRCIQIQKRQRNGELTSVVEGLFDLSSGRAGSIIYAQMWPSDMKAVESQALQEDIQNHKVFCYLAPHKLNDTFLTELISELKYPYYLISKDNIEADIQIILANYQASPRLIISQIPGILCEIYPRFNYCYVGGGFEKGVHSLLEPFVGQCSIACGPNVTRSTEYDIAKELGHEIKLYTNEELKSFYNDLRSRELNSVDVSSFIKQNEAKMNWALGALGILND